MPTLVQLEYVLAVEKHRHFGEASKACHVTQPTLSQQLQKLEDEIGLILFDRTKKPILPTEEGRLFLEQAKAVLREQEKLMATAKQAKNKGVNGDFRLGVIPTVASELIPRFVSSFSKLYPGVELYIEELRTENILAELNSDKLDGAILATPIRNLEFHVHPLYYEPFYAYFAPGHDLLKKSEILRQDLDASEMWLLEDGHCFKDQIASYCAFPSADGAVLGNIHFQSGSLDTLLRLIRSSKGYTLIPAMMASSLKKGEKDLYVRSFKPPFPSREISMVYRRGHWKLEIIKAIEASIKTTLVGDLPLKPSKAYKILEVC